MKNYSELHQSVPEALKKRLLKILPENFFDGDNVFEEDKTKMKVVLPDINAEIEKRMPTLDLILEERDFPVDGVLDLMQEAYQDVQLKKDVDLTHNRWEAKKVNWIAEYSKKKLRRHRVQWNSKLYRDNPKNWQNKSMIENGE